MDFTGPSNTNNSIAQLEYGSRIQADIRLSRIIWASDITTVIKDPNYDEPSLEGVRVDLDPPTGGKLQLIRGRLHHTCVVVEDDLPTRSSLQLGFPLSLLLDNEDGRHFMHEHMFGKCIAMLGVVESPTATSPIVIMTYHSSHLMGSPNPISNSSIMQTKASGMGEHVFPWATAVSLGHPDCSMTSSKVAHLQSPMYMGQDFS